MKTTARPLVSVGVFSFGIRSINLIKSRINCNTGFARNLIEKYSYLSDSEFPPASFVFFENGQEENNQGEKGQILSLLLQILHCEDNFQNNLFQNMIFNNITAEAEFRIEQMKSTSAKDYREFTKLFENTVRLIKTEIEENRKSDSPAAREDAGREELERQYEKHAEAFPRADQNLQKMIEKEREVNARAVEKQLYKIEEDNIKSPVLTLKEGMATEDTTMSVERKGLRAAAENEKEAAADSAEIRWIEWQEKYREESSREHREEHQTESSREHAEAYRREYQEKYRQEPQEPQKEPWQERQEYRADHSAKSQIGHQPEQSADYLEKRNTEVREEDFFPGVDKNLQEMIEKEREVNARAVEKQLYKIEEDNIEFPVLTLKERMATEDNTMSAERKGLRAAAENEKEAATDSAKIRWIEWQEKYRKEHREESSRDSREESGRDFQEESNQEFRLEHQEEAFPGADQNLQKMIEKEREVNARAVEKQLYKIEEDNIKSPVLTLKEGMATEDTTMSVERKGLRAAAENEKEAAADSAEIRWIEWQEKYREESSREHREEHQTESSREHAEAYRREYQEKYRQEPQEPQKEPWQERQEYRADHSAKSQIGHQPEQSADYLEKRNTEVREEDFFPGVDKNLQEMIEKEREVNARAVEKQLYKIEEDNIEFPVLTLKERMATEDNTMSAERKGLRAAAENEKEAATDSAKIRWIEWQEKYRKEHREESSRDSREESSREFRLEHQEEVLREHAEEYRQEHAEAHRRGYQEKYRQEPQEPQKEPWQERQEYPADNSAKSQIEHQPKQSVDYLEKQNTEVRDEDLQTLWSERQKKNQTEYQEAQTEYQEAQTEY
ncbi:MAG: hypothetical protein RR466_04570, partial [Hungatella sp.]